MVNWDTPYFQPRQGCSPPSQVAVSLDFEAMVQVISTWAGKFYIKWCPGKCCQKLGMSSLSSFKNCKKLSHDFVQIISLVAPAEFVLFGISTTAARSSGLWYVPRQLLCNVQYQLLAKDPIRSSTSRRKQIQSTSTTSQDHQWHLQLRSNLRLLSTKNSKHFLNSRILHSHQQASGTEDCLYLGLYSRPWVTTQSLRPVVVVFFGGAYIEGGGSFAIPPPAYPVLNASASNDLIFVYPNYRVNGFGFLPGKEIHDDPKSDLNPGLLDQHAVLQWTNKYIEKFGGDPKNVTIWVC